ncbi:hypothetical protein [Paenibacillus sp. GYB003]|uniref:hypothetical protein n=1 Tax=Paenibacillus sp. GYB003 TaxID=2994392 RepID=UPI002F96DC80
MDEKRLIIIGTGNEELDEILKSDLEQNGVGQVVSKIATRNILLKRVAETSANMVIVGEDLIGTDGTDEEWEVIFDELRDFSLQIRIIFICERPDDDLFLARLTTFSIFDIFNDGSIPHDFIRQITKPPEFKNIQKFKKNIRKATEDLIQEQREREAEKIIKTGVVPKTEHQVIKTTVPIYERLLIPPQLIVIASAFECSGSSTFGKVFLEYLAKLRLHVGMLESPFSKPSWFDFLNAKPIVSETGNWRSWHHQIEIDAQISTGHDITIRDVTYLIRNKGEDVKDWDVMKTAQLVGMARQIPILFYDLSSNICDEREKLVLRQANHLFLVTSFDPVRVNREFRHYKKMLENVSVDRVTLICNRSNQKLEKSFGEQIKSAYSIERIYYLPLFEKMLEISMEGTSVWDHVTDDLKESLDQLFYQLAALILGEETLKKLRPEKKEGGFLKKLFGK